jgi:hypothetical protein
MSKVLRIWQPPTKIKNHGWSCHPGQAVAVFDPPHAQSPFRIYDSLASGAQRWTGHHRSIAGKNPTYLAVVVSCAYSRSHEAARISTQGEPYAFALSASRLTFCDSRGSRSLDLRTGAEGWGSGSCPANEEANTSCSGLGDAVSVRAPVGEPNDIVDAGAFSFPMNGRVHDCADNGDFIVVATGSRLVLIDTAKGRAKDVSATGGEHVAIGPGWIARAAGTTVHVEPSGSDHDHPVRR